MQHKGRSAPRALRILITSDTASPHAGPTQVDAGPCVLDLARALLRKGHKPIVYGTVSNGVADALRSATIPVIDDLAALAAAPDVIHGQHHLETMTAALHFAGTPVIASCRAWMSWEATPPVFPTIARWIAADDLCAERLATTAGVDPARVRTLLDALDPVGFPPRDPLPATPRRALVTSDHGMEDAHVATIVRACHQAGIAMDIAGPRLVDDARGDRLRHYDVVFTHGHAALEAMAVGCATVVAGRAGFAGLVTPANFEALRALNFGARALQAGPVTEAAVLAAIGEYDAADALHVARRVRTEADVDALADALVVQYREAIDAGRFPDPVDCTQAAARYLRETLSPMVKSVEQANAARRDAEAARDAQADNARAAAVAAEKRIDTARQAREAAMTERAVALKAHDDMEVRLERALQRSLDAGIERDAAFAAREEARDAQMIATRAQARTAEALADALRAQAQLALDLAESVRAQAQLAADVDDARARLASVQAELDAARQAETERRRSKTWRAFASLRNLRAKPA